MNKKLQILKLGKVEIPIYQSWDDVIWKNEHVWIRHCKKPKLDAPLTTEEKKRSRPIRTISIEDNPLLLNEDDRQTFKVLLDIVDNHRLSFFSIINSRPEWKWLKEWIDSKVPKLLKQKVFIPDLGTKCLWIFRGFEDFQVCHGKDCKNIVGMYNTGPAYSPEYCCNKCEMSDQKTKDKIIATCQELHGEECTWTSKSQEAKDAYKTTCNEKYGCDNTFQVQEFKNKAKKTCEERHGDPNYRNDQQRIQTNMRLYGQGSNGKAVSEARNNFSQEKWDNINSQISATKLENHGDPCYNNHEKCVQTVLNEYGVSCVFLAPEIQTQISATLMENLGVDHNWKSPEVRENMRKNHREKYGVDHPMQRPEIIQKSNDTKIKHFGMPHSPSRKYSYDNKWFDSSWELAYYIWLKDHNIDFQYPCQVSFEYFDSKNRKHYYHPDFKVEGTYIEIKGDQFLNEKGQLIPGFTGKIKSKKKKIEAEKLARSKFECMKRNQVTMLTKHDIIVYVDYVKETYGKNFLMSFQKKKERRNKRGPYKKNGLNN